jgi:octaprenyl-diphosphate synthase
MTAYIVDSIAFSKKSAKHDDCVSTEPTIIPEISRKVKDLSQRHPLAPASLESIRDPIAEDLEAVDAVIRRRLDSEVALIGTISNYIIASGGKRLRPALVLLSANAFGARGPARHELAAVIEFIHTATLLHDDVVDESSLRRGHKTANAEFGNAASVLVGDFLYSRAFQMIVEVGSLRIMKVLADATNVIAEGEVLQLLNVHDADTDEEKYLRVIRYKTAKLFEAATQVGAILGEAPAALETALAEYGMHLGTAFQLIGDVLDIRLHAELGIEEDLAALRTALEHRAVGRRQRQVDRRHNPRQRRDVDEKLGNAMIGAGHAETVFIGIETIAVHDAVGRHFRDLQSGTPGGIRNGLEERRDFVRRGHQMTKDGELAGERIALGAHLRRVALRHLGLGQDVERIERVETSGEESLLLVLRLPVQLLVDRDAADEEQRHHEQLLIARILW